MRVLLLRVAAHANHTNSRRAEIEVNVQEIDFQPEKRTVEELFVGADYYVIPRFQRPYSWEAANLDEFWRDVVYDNNIGYFIGPMVAWRDGGSPIRRVVDGQQRLTTIAIMFAVLRDQFDKLGERPLAEGLHRYLEKADRNNEPQFTLQTEVASSFLSQAIFQREPDRSVTPSTEEETALSKALEGIATLIQGEVDRRQSPSTWLKNLRDRLLGLRVIWIEHSNEDDAYVLFETLNSRGKDLEVVDLLKNHLLNRLRGTGNAAADVSRAKWDRMRGELEGSDSRKNISANRFILHWWLSQEEYVAERKLFSAVKKKIKTTRSARTHLNSLAEEAKLYRASIEPSSRNWPIEEQAAFRSLQALATFGIVQPAPLLLSLLRARTAATKLGVSQLNRTLAVIERFHFQHTVVSQLRSSGGVSEMYAKAARELSVAADDQQKRADALKEIRRKLYERGPDRDQFVLAFKERFYFTDEFTRDSRLIRYVLAAFLREANPATGLENLSLEHIMPQRRLKENEQFETVGSLGNLLLVSEKVNGQLKDKAFENKKPILATSGKPFDIGGVLDAGDWAAEDIEKRTEMLAERAFDRTWKLVP